ncbi:Thiopurine S-methyltransferase [Falsiruegeria litorea R37]|uniref:Thiopurine S-methyltransferase n=1 Tax=Falsiruegeria litorea R37 TaxID=1200284 RepID=A0A1Y5TQY3_9RHOB|nr:thiopurine S-methyltransferase [Falsiruegeria litorea]SLN69479.1 Thiopurine S-methyltransferase [Falsiruegeria litorea R37]
MDRSFWINRWEENRLGWHQVDAHHLLVKFIDAAPLPQGSRVFVPLCGKTRDIGWLLSKGYRVVAAELSEIAIRQLFDDLGFTPEVKDLGTLKHFKAPDLDVFVGDVFDINPEQLGPVDLTHDRAAMVALPDDMRARYVAHLANITDQARQFVISFDYDQSLIAGPPFSVPEGQIKAMYGGRYTKTLLFTHDIPGGLKGVAPAQEQAWLLERR